MIRFIDMRPADISGVRFGFWDTVHDRMVQIGDDQGWDDIGELRESAEHAGLGSGPLGKLTGLCPAWTGEHPGSSGTDLHVGIAQLRQARPEPEPVVVDELRRLLEQAEAGSLVGIIVFGRAVGGQLEKTHVGVLSRVDVIAGCEILKHEMIHAAFGAPDKE